MRPEVSALITTTAGGVAVGGARVVSASMRGGGHSPIFSINGTCAPNLMHSLHSVALAVRACVRDVAYRCAHRSLGSLWVVQCGLTGRLCETAQRKGEEAIQFVLTHGSYLGRRYGSTKPEGGSPRQVLLEIHETQGELITGASVSSAFYGTSA